MNFSSVTVLTPACVVETRLLQRVIEAKRRVLALFGAHYCRDWRGFGGPWREIRVGPRSRAIPLPAWRGFGRRSWRSGHWQRDRGHESSTARSSLLYVRASRQLANSWSVPGLRGDGRIRGLPRAKARFLVGNDCAVGDRRGLWGEFILRPGTNAHRADANPD